MRLASLLSVLALATTTFSLAACSTSSDSSDDTSTADPQTNDGADEELKAAVIGEESNGKTVEVQLGRSFTIALQDSSASSGYGWHIVSADPKLGKVIESYVAPDPKKIGAKGTAKFHWAAKPLVEGNFAIEIGLSRSWETGKAPIQTFKVTIAVKKPGAKHCGGLAGLQCDKGQYCEFTAKQACGMADQTGTCTAKPEICPEFFSPVCGCDGKTYGNSCFANSAGTSVSHTGECGGGGVKCGDTTCGAGDVCCNPVMSICTKPGMFCIQ